VTSPNDTPIEPIDDACQTMAACQRAGVQRFLVLDFDGVLNSLMRHGTFPDGTFWPVETELVPAMFAGEEYVFRIQYSPELIRRLNGLLADPGVQLVWLTSWQIQIRRVERMLGIEPRRRGIVLMYPVAAYDNQSGKGEGLRAFQAGAAGGARVAWIDDDFLADWRGPVADTVADALPTQRAADVLTICPNADHGINRAEWDAVEAWLGAGPDHQLT